MSGNGPYWSPEVCTRELSACTTYTPLRALYNWRWVSLVRSVSNRPFSLCPGMHPPRWAGSQAGLMAGITGLTPGYLEATAIVLLAFAIIAYMIGVYKKIVRLMWITPFFATWSVIVWAAFLNDLFRPPMVALVAAALGMAV